MNKKDDANVSEPVIKDDPLEQMFNINVDLKENNNLLVDQYKLYVEMADRISARRATTNNFFLTANSFLFIAMGALINTKFFILVPIILLVGIFFCIGWYLLIQNYRSLNSAKYKVINEIETKMPVAGFLAEYQILKMQDKESRKRRFSNIESWIPLCLVIMYTLAIIALAIYIGLYPEVLNELFQ
ncbi:MAG TPA: hypothetical protein VMX55_05990 [candidate division Zixibacteria bacterium]|nr:hypothetical protein [candidate division Zixibacteria bacterium]